MVKLLVPVVSAWTVVCKSSVAVLIASTLPSALADTPLIVATEFNDVLQYVWGKLLGRRKILPKVSPNKTWEGFLGGWASTAALIWFVGPLFAPLEGVSLAVMAAVLPVAGFAGDVTMSAVKRDLGVKDTSQLIPGHGGLLDRIDSLTFTAPVYFHLLAFFAFVRF